MVTLINEPAPLYEKLITMRETFTVGLRAAELSGSSERAGWYREALGKVQSQIAALHTPIGGEGRRGDIKSLSRAYAAKQVTPREFGARMKRLVRAP